MYKVMVVEDSKPILRNIQKQIESVDSRLKIMKTAFNGMEALDLLKTTDIDVLFTDIRMPKMDGLTLIQEAIRIKPNLKVFLLSGYNDFEYARQAIKLNVCEYLLKPLDLKELNHSLKKVIQDLDHEKGTAIEQWISTRLASYRLEEHIQCPIKTDSYLLCIIRRGLIQNNELSLNNNMLQTYAYKAFSEEVFYVADTPNSCQKVLLLCSNKDYKDVSDRIESLFHSLQSEMPRINMVVSPIEQDISQIDRLYSTLNNQLDNKVRMNRTQIIYGEQDYKSIPVHDELEKEHLNIKIQYWMKNYQKNEIIRKFEEILFGCEKMNASIVKLKIVITVLLTVVADNMPEEEKRFFHPEEKANTIILQSVTYTDIMNNFMEIALPLIERVVDTKQSSIDTFSALDSFLKANLYRNIRLQDICQEMNYSASYIIRVVKRFRGMTPIEYYTDLKINEAKKLIDENEKILIKDVAEWLCFSDQHYFCKVFKRYSGYSPSKYKERAAE